MRIDPGTFLGPYEIVASIEVGGMGSVFRAVDSRLRREVAIKVLPADSMSDEHLVKRFQREARAAAALAHPNIVAIYDVGEADVLQATPIGRETVKVAYLVEELVEGSSLRRLIRAGGVPLGRIVSIAIDIARGLLAAHDKGLIHRDLKPENILLDSSGRPKIADFGLVRWIYPETSVPSSDGDLTRTGFVVGTLGYMSPEQARGDPLGPASDLFVLGTLMYEMLTGVAPFARPNVDEAFRAVLKESPPPILSRIPEAPPDLVRIIETCLEKDLTKRYSSASQIIGDLERLRRALRLDERGQTIKGSGVASRPRASRRARAPLVWLATAVAVVLAFNGGYAVGRRAAAPVGPGLSLPLARPEAWTAQWRSEICAEGARESGPSDAVLSPDGARAVVTVATGDESDLFLVAVRGPSVPRRLTADDAGGRAPFITGNGSRIVYSSARLDRPVGIWDVALDGGDPPKALVEEGEDPALSPDESTLVFVRRREDGSDLWLARRDGLLRRRLLWSAGAVWRYPVFTPNGAGILVYEVRKGAVPFAGSAQLVLVPIADPRRIPFDESRRLDPDVRATPLEGGSVLVCSWGDRSAYVLEARGRQAHRLPFGAALSALSAVRNARSVLTMSDGGPLILWRRS